MFRIPFVLAHAKPVGLASLGIQQHNIITDEKLGDEYPSLP